MIQRPIAESLRGRGPGGVATVVRHRTGAPPWTVVAVGAGSTLAILVTRIGEGRPAFAILAIFGFCAGVAFMAARDKRRFFLGALTLALPFAATDFFVGAPPVVFHAGGAQIVPEVNIVDLLFIPGVVLLLLSRPRRLSLPYTPTAAFAAFLIWSGLSIVGSDHRLLGLVSLLDLAKVFLLWLCVVMAVQGEDDCRLMARCLAAGLLLQGAVGILQWGYGVPDWAQFLTKGGDPTYLESLDDRSFTRVGGTIGWSTTFAQYLELLTPLSLVLFCTARSRLSRAAYGLSAVSAAAAMVLTLSRAGWLALLVGSLISMAAVWRQARAEVRKRIRLLAAVGSLGLLMSLPLVVERLESNDQGSARSRLAMSSVALRVIEAHPLLGVGLNSYTEVMHDYDPEHLIAGFLYPVHNVYLFVAAEVGLPGLFLMLVFYGAILKGLVRAVGEAPAPTAAIAAGLLGGLTGMLTVHAPVETSFKQELPLWYAVSVVCGLAVSLRRWRWRQEGSRVPG